MGAASRYKRRQRIWQQKHRVFPWVRHQGWWVLHNCVSHPLLGVRPSKRTVWFHDWTSQHLNCRTRFQPSPMPEIPSYRKWLWHNVVGHMAIGLVPVEASFVFHDRTSKDMNVPMWV